MWTINEDLSYAISGGHMYSSDLRDTTGKINLVPSNRSAQHLRENPASRSFCADRLDLYSSPEC